MKWIMLLLFVQVCTMRAQTIAGGEIYYKQLGSRKYLATAHVYRECGNGPLNGLNGFVIADTFRISMNFKRTSIQRINDTCNNPCNSKNAVSNPGYERHTYTDTIDFNVKPYKTIADHNLCTVRFAIHQGLRNGNSTTYSLGNGMFYLDAQVNMCLGFSNVQSPAFSFEPKFLYACNQPAWYTPGPIDSTDFDSLAFSLEDPLFDIQTPVKYKGSYNKLIPMTPYCPPNPGVINCRALPGAKPPRGFYFDNSSCQVGVTPVDCKEVAAIKFKISEWRRDSTGKMVLIGYVCREMQAVVQSMPDNNPAIFPRVNMYNVCSGKRICFNTSINDELFLPKQTIPDTVTLDWDRGIPDASFTITNPTDRLKTSLFCWDSTAKYKTGFYHFNMMAYDRMCNINLQSSAFRIGNFERAKYSTSFSRDSCNTVRYKVVPAGGSTFVGGNVSIINVSGKTIFGSSRMTDSATVNANGRYYIRYAIYNYSGDPCPVISIDTLDVFNALPKGFEFTAADTVVCASYPAQLSFSPANIPGVSAWTWYRNDTLLSMTDTAINGIVYGTTAFRLHISDSRGCTSESKRTYYTKKVSQNLFAPIYTVCPGQTVTLVPISTQLVKPLTSQWIYNGKDTSFTGDTFTLAATSKFNIHVRVTDANHCIVDDQLLLDTLYHPKLSLLTSKQQYCADSVVKITGKLAYPRLLTGTYWKINGIDTVTGVSMVLEKAFDKSTQVILLVDGDSICPQSDTIIISPIPNPHVSLSGPGILCPGETALVKAVILNSLPGRSVSWQHNGTMLSLADTQYSFVLHKDAHVRIRVANEALCYDEDTLLVSMFPDPQLHIVSDTMFNRYNRISMSTGKPYASYQWSNGSKTRDNVFWAYELGKPGRYMTWCEVTDANGCTDRDTIWFHTDQFTSVDKAADKTVVKCYPNPVSDRLVIETEKHVDAFLYDGQGKLVLTVQLHAGENIMRVSDLVQGLYLLSVDGVLYHISVVKQ